MARDTDPDYCFYVLRWIRQLYIALHQDTDAAPTAFNASTKDKDDILSRPSSYPFCNLAEHHPHPPVPHPTQPIPGSSAAPQQAGEAHVISELPAKEFMQTFGPDLNRLVSNLSTLVSLLSSQPSLSTANLTTKIRPNDEPTPDISIKVDPVPVTVTPSIIAYPSSVSVEQQDAHKREDTTVSHARSDITLVSSDATEIPPSLYRQCHHTSKRGLTGVPPTTVSDSQSSLIVALPSTSSVIPTEPPPLVESTLVQLDPLLHPFGSLPSTSTTAHSHIASQVPAFRLDVPLLQHWRLRFAREHETRDPNAPAPTEASLRVQETGSSTRKA
ncbi:hypothetical protein BGY98DRAFT_678534 [Russula aff. rugulosa BPL654]|nr:hypothetical protein BGY98DRAFT_678534 [Russula aff. rugulosa BPL654]